MPTPTTNQASFMTSPAPRFLRRMARVATGTSTRSGGDSGPDGDIMRRGGAARWGHRRYRDRYAPCMSHASAACGLGGNGGAHGVADGTAPPRQVRSPLLRRSGPGGLACSLRTDAPRAWYVLSARQLCWCDAGGGGSGGGPLCRLAAALPAAPERPGGGLACSRVMPPRVLWCGFGRVL